MNHCFDDVERFMARLQQTAEAQSVLNQTKKKKSRKSKKNKDQDDDLLTLKACPPSEEEFVDIFQKIKYSLCLLVIFLMFHLVQPFLSQMVETTGGPALGASVVSPAMTSGAVSLLQKHLTEEEKQLWTSLGHNWTICSHLSVSGSPYSPVFLDGWQPQAYNSTGQLIEDPITSQHKQDAFRESRQAQTLHDQARRTAEEGTWLPPEGERLYCCSYDFVARNSSELSVLQGETLEVIESSKRWWKCRNRFDQIGFVPSNILEPLSALNNTGRDIPVVRRESQKTPIYPRTKYFSYAPPSQVGTSPTAKILKMNDELFRRLAGKRDSVRPLVVPRTSDTSSPLNYHSSSAEVEAWLTAKGFIQSLGILNGAQLFSLNKEELRTVSPEEGARAYSQIMVQKALLEVLDEHLKAGNMKINLRCSQHWVKFFKS
uniref:EPS8 signaling adaptor L1a n=1 Tax=Sander lucioperca TaxID=283035 RepID=A0A8C9Y8R6_SANLU